MQRGLIPLVSLTPISLSFVKITMAKEPFTTCIALNIALSIPLLAYLAISPKITSESVVLWKINPHSCRRSLNVSALVKFPLCAMAIEPSLPWVKSGCALHLRLSPAVEYLTCPIAALPVNSSSISSSNTSVTSPISL